MNRLAQPRQRNKYDTFLVWLYINDKQHLVPEGIREIIPNSTVSTWRKTGFSSFVGSEVRQIQEEAVSQYELFEAHQNLKRTVRVITKVWITLSNILLPVLHKGRQYSEVFINQVQRLFTVMPKRLAFRLAEISPASFYERLSKIKSRCGISPLELCMKRHPLQLARGEVKKIKELFMDTRFACWPAVSLYYEGLRDKGLHISLSTFYKYVGLLGLQRKWNRGIAKTKGLQASMPNQYLHVDTTFWELRSAAKSAIVFVSDNFSKALLGWNLSLQKTAENVRQALDMSIDTINHHHPQHLCSVLVADGGSENHALTIEELLVHTERPGITKVIALKDIAFSNSPIEAINKIMKRYLRHYQPQTIEELEKTIAFAVDDYNNTRPHGSLHGLTPMEAYTQSVKLPDFHEQMRQAKALRIAENRKTNCNICLTE